MRIDNLSFIVVPHSDESIQLGIAEPAGLNIRNSLTFEDRQMLKSALQRVGLPGRIAWDCGLSAPRRVNALQLMRLGFF